MFSITYNLLSDLPLVKSFPNMLLPPPTLLSPMIYSQHNKRIMTSFISPESLSVYKVSFYPYFELSSLHKWLVFIVLNI
jgi:hypothetical protein